MRRIPPRGIERQTCDLACSIEATGIVGMGARVRNISIGGARLEGAELDNCPETFDLTIVHDSGAIESLSARVIWRSPGVIGVRFEEPEPATRPRLANPSGAP